DFKSFDPGSVEAHKSVQVLVEPWADDLERLCQAALDAARSGARVLVLRNTVKDACLTQACLEQLSSERDAPLLFSVSGKRTLHHSRFSRDDRIALDQAVEARFGKNAAKFGGCICVATQTVEQ